MSKFTDSFISILTIVVLLLAAIILLQPSSPLWTMAKSWRATRQLRVKIASEWSNLTIDGARFDDGKTVVGLIEFSDYECPFCRSSHAAVERLALTHTIGIQFHHLPLPIHRHAEGAARAAICAEAQGVFREMNRRLFETTEWQQDENWTREARLAGVPSIDQFSRCLSSPATISRLAADQLLAQHLGLTGTPAFITPTKIALNDMSDERLSAFIKEQ